MTRLRILVLVDYYLPGFLAGGPIRSIANMVASLSDRYDWYIVTQNRDAGGGSPYSNVINDAWQPVGAAHVYYISKPGILGGRVAALVRSFDYDVLYLNSFFSLRFSIGQILRLFLRRLAVRPIVIAPRGEFSPGAYRLKNWKKRPFVYFARLLRVYRNVYWHASTLDEAGHILSTLHVDKKRINVARNIVSRCGGEDPFPARDRLDSAPLRVCFLSRVTRKKNLDYALRVLSLVKCPIEFTVYGPVEDDEYREECEHLIRMLPKAIVVRFAGPVPHEEVQSVLRQEDLFFLPTLGENFGHVFVEAWSSGLCVLTSDQTPWRNLENLGVGWDIPLNDVSAYVGVLNAVSLWRSSQRIKSRAACQEFAACCVRDDSGVESSISMFEKAFGDFASRG